MVRPANSVPPSAYVAPTERSKPPLMITKVIPTAMMPTAEFCERMSVMFPQSRKPGYRIVATITRTTSAPTMP
jgi:hypothetical protein